MSRQRFSCILLTVALLFASFVSASVYPSAATDATQVGDYIDTKDVPNKMAPFFDRLRNRTPGSEEVISAFEKNFSEDFVKLTGPKFSDVDIGYIKKICANVFRGGEEYRRILSDPKMTPDEKSAALDALIQKQHSGSQGEPPPKFLAKVALHGSGPGTEPDAGEKGTFIGVIATSAQKAFAPHDGVPAGNLPSAPDLAIVIGAPQNPNDASSEMGTVGDKLLKGDLSGALNAANKAVELGGGAPALALRGGIELDQKDYSKASQDAQHALQLDPTNKDASALAHFASGRTDGVGSSGPAGAKAADASGGGGGGGGAGGASVGVMGGSESSVGGGRSGVGASSSLQSGWLSSGGLAAGGAPGSSLSRMSGEQARGAALGALAMGDLGGAMTFVNRALAQNPRDPGLLNLRSRIRAGQHDYAGAEADAKAGLELAPRDSALLRSLGFAQLREKDYNAAIATANKMLELNPNDPYAYAIRGHAYGSMGDRDAMMSDLKRAAELDPSFREAAESLGGQLELPSDKDILFLFPGETSAAAATKAAPVAGRGQRFGLLVGASALGGLLLALGLLATVLAPLKERVTSAFTRFTRTGPTLGAAPAEETEQPASVNGLLPGLIRGQYEISRQIGSGGMGMVFAGLDRALGRPVAIKKMRDELRHDPREKARFVSEAKTVAALHHPNIVDIYAIAEEGDDVFLVFEYVEGKTIHELLTGAGKLAPAAAAKIVRASADALEYAHARGVIHRDMKPSNVMLDKSGVVKVMDFGIARMAKDTLLRQSMTNTIAGTPPYMAPEQEQGRVRSESDVYSLAVCAYEMLTGKLPFIGSGGGMLMNKINMSFVPPSRQTAGLPESLDGVFERAFQADPDKRFRTPREFSAALESAGPVAGPLRA